MADGEFNRGTRDTDFFVNRTSSRVDIARNTKWRLIVPESITRFLSSSADYGDRGKNGLDRDTNWIDIHTANLPEPKILTTETFYMGMPEKHVVGAQISGAGTFSFYARENMTLYSALLAAMQVEFNAGVLAQSDNVDIVRNAPQLAYDYTSDHNNGGPQIKLGLGTRKIFDDETLSGADPDSMTASAVRSFDTKSCIITEIFDWMRGFPILRIYYVNPKITGVKLSPGLAWKHQAQLMMCDCTFEYDRPVIYPISRFLNDDYLNGLEPTGIRPLT